MTSQPKLVLRGYGPDSHDVDEVVLTAGDGCTFHLECLDDNLFWFAATLPDGRSVACSIGHFGDPARLVCRVDTDARTAEERAADERGPERWEAWESSEVPPS